MESGSRLRQAISRLKSWENVWFTFRIFIAGMLVFTVFRIIFLIAGWDNVKNAGAGFNNLMRAMVMGIRFDVVVSSYLLFLPFLLITIAWVTGSMRRLLRALSFWIAFGLYTLAFFISAADIPYFNQFFSRITNAAFQWMQKPGFVFRMVMEEPGYWVYLIPFFILLAGFYLLLRRIVMDNSPVRIKNPLWLKALVTVAMLVFMFAGARGRLAQKAPIKVGTAYIFDNPFLNQLGLNPVFTMLQSIVENLDHRNDTIRLMDDRLALANVQRYLDITRPNPYYPLYRFVQPDSIKHNRPNVVIIIMESMAASKMKRNGNSLQLTPFLDSLALNSYYFDSIYTAGIHTFNGIFSTLFSYPALFKQQPMRESNMLRYNGIASTLSNFGYSTAYFTTHDGQFDNVEGFLHYNGFDTIISEKDYPDEAVKTTLGVPDDFMFRYSIPLLNQMHQSGKPFLAAFMTASNHGPYYIPDYFRPKNKNIKDGVIEYADWALHQFIMHASQQSWFKNTLFVFVADHGIHKKNTYEISLQYHHTPLIFYAPGLLKGHRIFNQIGGQIDVFPTIMGLLGFPYINNTLGIDLMRQSRPYIFVNSMTNYGVIGKKYFLIVRRDNTAHLYQFKNGSLKNYSKARPLELNAMNEYARSNLQAFQYILSAKRQFVK